MRKAIELLVGSCVVYAVVVACGQAPHVPEKVAAQAGEPAGVGEASPGGGRSSIGGQTSDGGTGGLLDPVPDAGGGGEPSTGGITADTAGAGGDPGEPDPQPGGAGAGGAACVPLEQREACSGKACGSASDGCDGTYQCGASCGALGVCDSGVCKLNPECDCSSRECGVLGLCPEIRFCADGQALAEPDQSYCGSAGALCVVADSEATCVQPSSSVCRRVGDTCCSTQPAGCRYGYARCEGLHAVTRFGTICGTCQVGTVTHYCGTGEIEI